MNILSLILSTLYEYNKEMNTLRLVESNGKKTVSMYTMDDTAIPSVHNLGREVLYEGFVSLDTILFLLETKILTNSNLNSFLEDTVLKARRMLLKDASVFKYFLNFSTKVDCKDKKIRTLLERRNSILDSDKSQIALVLTKERIQDLNKRLTTDLLLFDDKKEKEYLRMVYDLSGSRYGDDGVSVNLSKERFEFYRENVALTVSQIEEAKISLNLGGSIFSPSLLAQLTKGITIPDKRDVLKKSLIAIFEPLHILKKNIVNRSFMDKKKEIIDFLINCLEIRTGQYRESVDNAFYHRSLLIGFYLKDNENGDEMYKILDRLQEEAIKKLIFVFENLKEKHLGVCLVDDPELIERYLNYLCDGQDSSKSKLLNFLKPVSI
ncbi:hypothetical protein NGRA_2401 [Nosema granulosis]|uniref:Uncharacterized protein n=1 Tax=Nosema granulosis TaxID=83296 RepID=A0A9P6GWP1_9MICR|nr:hypothetical protein NGRA_2401 [Nosema granulosis]